MATQHYSDYEYFTHGKIDKPEFTIFFNIAYFKIAGMINNLLGETHEINKKNLEDKIYSVECKTKWRNDERVMSGLCNYLFKSYRKAKNSEGYKVTDVEKRLAFQMIEKMNELRNFHSHFYHDSFVKVFSADLKKSIEAFFKETKIELSSDPQNAFALIKYEATEKDPRLFELDPVKNSWFIKTNGTIFFLSFFLTKGEMSQLLSQCKGFKRSDSPAFKIKRDIFSEYAKRDGAARHHSGQDEDSLSAMNEEEKQSILDARQAFKLISYLNDVPSEANDLKLFPLFDDNKPVDSLDDFSNFCKKHNLFSDFSFKKATITKTDVKTKETTTHELPNQIDLCFETYCIRLSKNTLHKLILDCFRAEKKTEVEIIGLKKTIDELVLKYKTPNETIHKIIFDGLTSRIKDIESANETQSDDEEAVFKVSLDYFIRERLVKNEQFDSKIYILAIHSILQNKQDSKGLIAFAKFIAAREQLTELELKFKPDPKNNAIVSENGKFTLTEEIDQLYRFRIKNEKLEKLMGSWLENKLVGTGKFSYDLRIDFKKKIKTEPIELVYNDLFFEAEEKPRVADLFVKYAVQYLIDFNIVPNWYFMQESFGDKDIKKTDKGIETTFTPEVRHICYSNINVKNFRLALTPDNQIVLGVYTEEEAENKKAGIAPTNKFLLGAAALKNLLIAHLIHKKDNFKEFFKDIIEDITAIKKGKKLEYTDLKILGNKNYLPKAFRIAMQTERFEIELLRTKAVTRIKNISTELSKHLEEGAPKLSRAEKNELIMRCYKFFDWEYTEGGEFKFLRKDEYHSLSKYHYTMNEIKQPNGKIKTIKYNDLIQNIRNHMPVEVKELLNNAKDIDNLLELTIEKTKIRLEKRRVEILGKFIKGKKLNAVYSKLGISINSGKTALPDFLPFDIHPMLPLEAFYKTELEKAKKKTENETVKMKNNNTPFSLIKNAALLTNPAYKKGLRNVHYDYSYYREKVLGAENTKLEHDIIGSINTLCAKDILLWEITKKYLSKTNPAHQTYLVGNDKNKEWRVNYLRKSVIKIPFRDIGFGKVDLLIKFHQLDDYLFVESKNFIERALKQTLKRFKHQCATDEGVKNLKTEITNYAGKFYTEKITNDSAGYCVLYSDVRKEMQRTFNESLWWVAFILKWEEKIIKPMRKIQIDQLVTESKNKDTTPGSDRIGFEALLKHQGLTGNTDVKENELGKTLQLVRNKTFHTEIPDTTEFSYWELEEAEKYLPLRDTLKFEKKPKFDYKLGLKKTL